MTDTASTDIKVLQMLSQGGVIAAHKPVDAVANESGLDASVVAESMLRLWVAGKIFCDDTDAEKTIESVRANNFCAVHGETQ